jgi:hypothetical protein
MQTNKDSRDPVRRAILEAAELPQPSIVDIDPTDPAQVLDDAVVDVSTDVDALPSAEADADVDAAVMESAAEEEEQDEDSEVDQRAREIDTPDQTTADAYADAAEDTGDLYGVHQPAAEDKDLDETADRESFVDSEGGEHWLETLGKKSAESGPEVEETIDVEDDSDEHRGHHKSDNRDRPVADKGSGGPGGL